MTDLDAAWENVLVETPGEDWGSLHVGSGEIAGVRLDDLLTLPRLVGCRELWVEFWRDGHGTEDFAAWVDALVKRPISTLRVLTLAGYSGRTADAKLGDASRLLRAMPDLESVTLAGNAESLGPFSSAKLTSLEFEPDILPVEVARRVLGTSVWPRLEELRLNLQCGFDLPDGGFQLIEPLLGRDGPQLELLELTGLDLSREHLAQLLASPVTARLRALLIGHCDLTDAEDAILEVADRFPNLSLYLGHDSPSLVAKGIRLAEHRGIATQLLNTEREKHASGR